MAVTVRALLAATLGLLVIGAGPAMAADWEYYGEDGLEVQSADGKTQAEGHVRWYHGSFPYGYRHRGDYARRSNVHAIKAVGCIWVKVSYGYPDGSFDVGSSGAGGSVTGGSYDASHGYYVSCRKKGHKRPHRLGLYGVGYAKGLLNSTTLEVCTSKNHKQGPRFCAFEKNTY